MLVHSRGFSAIAIVCLFVSVAASACDSTAPKRYGALKDRIVVNEQQLVVAGTPTSDTAVSQTYRERVAVAPTWPQRIMGVFMPQTAYAADTTVDIRAVSGAVACVSEDQNVLIPLNRCVTTDQAGLSAYKFINLPTKAGTYEASVYSTYGKETTQLVSIEVTVTGGPVDPNGTWSSIARSGVPVGSVVTDQYDNAVPFKLTGDKRIQPADTALGSLGARTVTFDASLVDLDAKGNVVWHGPLNVLGAGDVVIAKALYGIYMYGGKPMIDWVTFGLNHPPVITH